MNEPSNDQVIFSKPLQVPWLSLPLRYLVMGGEGQLILIPVTTQSLGEDESLLLEIALSSLEAKCCVNTSR